MTGPGEESRDGRVELYYIITGAGINIGAIFYLLFDAQAPHRETGITRNQQASTPIYSILRLYSIDLLLYSIYLLSGVNNLSIRVNGQKVSFCLVSYACRYVPWYPLLLCMYGMYILCMVSILGNKVI